MILHPCYAQADHHYNQNRVVGLLVLWMSQWVWYTLIGRLYTPETVLGIFIVAMNFISLPRGSKRGSAQHIENLEFDFPPSKFNYYIFYAHAFVY